MFLFCLLQIYGLKKVINVLELLFEGIKYVMRMKVSFSSAKSWCNIVFGQLQTPYFNPIKYNSIFKIRYKSLRWFKLQILYLKRIEMNSSQNVKISAELQYVSYVRLITNGNRGIQVLLPRSSKHNGQA